MESLCHKDENLLLGDYKFLHFSLLILSFVHKVGIQSHRSHYSQTRRVRYQEYNLLKKRMIIIHSSTIGFHLLNLLGLNLFPVKAVVLGLNCPPSSANPYFK